MNAHAAPLTRYPARSSLRLLEKVLCLMVQVLLLVHNLPSGQASLMVEPTCTTPARARQISSIDALVQTTAGVRSKAPRHPQEFKVSVLTGREPGVAGRSALAGRQAGRTQLVINSGDTGRPHGRKGGAAVLPNPLFTPNPFQLPMKTPHFHLSLRPLTREPLRRRSSL